MLSKISDSSVSVWNETLEYAEDGIKLDDLWPILDKYLKIENIAERIIKIINQDAEKKTDGECIDEIMGYLSSLELYKEK